MSNSWPEQIRRLRKAHGLTQQQAADLIGVHRVTICRWESGDLPNELVQERYVQILRSLDG